MWYLDTMEFYSATKNEILSFTSKWMGLKNIIISEFSQAQKAKATSLPSNVGYRPKANATILWDTGHTKGRPHTGEEGQRKEPNT
jgi:hypothetical protein